MQYTTMSKTHSISARINATDKKRAEAVFNRLGITASQAIAMFYKQVHLRRGIPFPVELPNETTIRSIDDSSSKKGKRFESPAALYDDLGI